MAFAETAELAVRLSLQDQFTGPLTKAGRSLNAFGGSVGKIGKGVGQLGVGLARVAAVGFTAVGAGLTGAAKAAIDFEDAFAGVIKTVDEQQLKAAGLTFDDLALSFRKMATEIPIAASEFARIGEAAGALGIKAQDIDDFTRTVALLGVTTDLTTDQASEALGKLGTILGLTGQDFEDFADTLVNLGNQGASTESEIIEVSKRFAAAGKQAGLSTNQILALSSAITSMGAEPEAAGGALSRIFANMAADIADASEAGVTFAKVTGDSLAELQDRINKGDALGILLETLQGIGKLSRTESASVLKALGITNVRDRDAILKMSQNLGFVNEQLQIAEESTGALGVESQKRFDTIASKLGLLKNQLVEIGINIGEGMLPAIGRATEALGKLLTDPKFITSAKNLGREIGSFIDSINWTEVLNAGRQLVDILRVAGELAVSAASALSKLPKEILGAGALAIGANKLSGGLLAAGVGNIAGGLGGSLLRGVGSKVPGIGRAFATPVYVVNMPPGGFGGGGGGAGAGGAGGAGFLAPGGLTFAAGVSAIVAALTVVPEAFKGPAGASAPPVFRDESTASAAGKAFADSIAPYFPQSLIAGNAQGTSKLTPEEIANAIAKDTRSEGIATRAALDAIKAKEQESLNAFRAAERAILNMPPPRVNVTVPVTVKNSISVRETQKTMSTFTLHVPPSQVQHR